MIVTTTAVCTAASGTISRDGKPVPAAMIPTNITATAALLYTCMSTRLVAIGQVVASVPRSMYSGRRARGGINSSAVHTSVMGR